MGERLSDERLAEIRAGLADPDWGPSVPITFPQDLLAEVERLRPMERQLEHARSEVRSVVRSCTMTRFAENKLLAAVAARTQSEGK